MNTDQTDWNGLYVPNVNKTFIQRDPAHNHYYFPPSDPLILFLNLTRAPFNQLAVRQAINLAIDRSKISTIGESGYEPVAHPTGLILPADKQFLDPTYANAQLTMNTTQASQILASRAIRQGSDGILVGSGRKEAVVHMRRRVGLHRLGYRLPDHRAAISSRSASRSMSPINQPRHGPGGHRERQLRHGHLV